MKILFMTDTDLKGSGFLNVSMPLCTGLVERGHDLIVAGLNYAGEEHFFPFRIIPTGNFQDFFAIFENLYNTWQFDVLMVAMDIPVQMRLISQLRKYRGGVYKYVGIMPVEADPLCFTWATGLMEMSKVFVISKFGTEECKKMGIDAEYFPVGIDAEAWPMVNPEDKKRNRKLLNISDDDFVVVTVADNQERKNLAAGMAAFASLNKAHPNSKYVLVTREHNYVGWNLRDYAVELGISKDFIIVERGIPQPELWSVMSTADVFMLPSKAEGLGLPLLDAMAMGIPCVATKACGMQELLGDGRGALISYEYVHRDPFGNGRRYWINVDELAEFLITSATSEIVMPNILTGVVKLAHDYAINRKWSDAIDVVDNYLKGLKDVEAK